MSNRIHWCVYSKQGYEFEDTVRSLRRNSIAAFMEPLKGGPDGSWDVYRKRYGCTVRKVRLVECDEGGG